MSDSYKQVHTPIISRASSMVSDNHFVLETLTAFVNAIVEERVDAILERRLQEIVADALANVSEFDVNDHVSDIEEIVNEVLSNTSFTVTVD
jgi:hypothetical protein